VVTVALSTNKIKIKEAEKTRQVATLVCKKDFFLLTF
jgi:hypothetical protein